MPDASNLMAFHPMASMARTVPMHSTLYRKDLTWPQYIDQKIMPQIDWGLRRFMFHLPFGKNELESAMSFDSLLVARERRLTRLYRGFARSMRSLTRQGIEVICYVGALGLDRDMLQLITKRYSDDNWIDRFVRSIRPILNSGCSIAYDAAGGGWSEGGPEHHAAKMLRALGTKSYIEGTCHPQERTAWLGSFDWTANHGHYWRNIADSEHGNTWPPRKEGYVSRWAQREEMAGRGTLMISGHAQPLNPDGTPALPRQEMYDTYHLWAPPLVQKDIAEDFDVAYWFFDTMHRMTIEQLMFGMDHGEPPVPPSIPPPSVDTSLEDSVSLQPNLDVQ